MMLTQNGFGKTSLPTGLKAGERDVVWNGDKFQRVPEGAYVDNEEE